MAVILNAIAQFLMDGIPLDMIVLMSIVHIFLTLTQIKLDHFVLV